jgi:hypothetical protein
MNNDQVDEIGSVGRFQYITRTVTTGDLRKQVFGQCEQLQRIIRYNSDMLQSFLTPLGKDINQLGIVLLGPATFLQDWETATPGITRDPNFVKAAWYYRAQRRYYLQRSHLFRLIDALDGVADDEPQMLTYSDLEYIGWSARPDKVRAGGT